MDKIEVKVLETHGDPGQWATFLARLTQRGHNIKCMADLEALFNQSHTPGFVEAIAQLPHGTIKRFTPITVAIVGASRRFLAQARTSQVGTNFVSASLQYSDYSGVADFVVPYAITEADASVGGNALRNYYLDSCNASMSVYSNLAKEIGNDAAGYAAPQGLRNILIMQANHQSWDYWIRLRGCNRNTVETQYVTMRIWEELLKTPDGQEFFGKSGADCTYGACREGKMCCGNPMRKYVKASKETGKSVPRLIIEDKWPLICN
jgi:thymidylate synthase (FAD)